MYQLAEDKRTYSREGFMQADAILATAGDLPYKRGEFGLPGNPNDEIILTRTKDALKKALPSFAGKPITIDHPSSFLGTGDATRKMVGAVTSTPTMDDAGNIKAKISIWDRNAIDMIEMGQNELSPGFVFKEPELVDGKGNIEDMALNHIALVQQGRAGQAVRIMDSLPTELIGIDNSEENDMPIDETKLADAIRQAVDSARKSKSDVAEAVDTAIKPLVEDIAALKAKDAKAEADAKVKEAKDAADADRKNAIDIAVRGERDRYKIIEDAKPFIAQDAHAGLLDMDAKDILKLAIGEDAGDVEDVAEMRGVLKGMKIAADKAVSFKPADGVVQRGPSNLTQAEDARAKKYADAYNKSRGIE